MMSHLVASQPGQFETNWPGHPAFLHHQEDMLQEYIESAKDDVESIKQTYTTDGTWTTINMKRNN